MQFITLSILTALLATLTAANPVAEPQTPEQSTAASEQLASYLQVLTADPNFLSVISALATDTSAIGAIQTWEASVESQIEAHQTPAPNFLDSLPSQARPVFSSVYDAEVSILTANGFTSGVPTLAGASAASTKSSTAGAAPTNALKAAGVLAAGFVGAVIAL